MLKVKAFLTIVMLFCMKTLCKKKLISLILRSLRVSKYKISFYQGKDGEGFFANLLKSFIWGHFRLGILEWIPKIGLSLTMM